jgi:hypothetical protein
MELIWRWMLCITCFVPDISCLFFFFFFQASLLSTGTGYLHGLAFVFMVSCT